jgi:hypothetical protein
VQDTRIDINVEAAIRQFSLGHLFSGLIENVYDSHIVFSVSAYVAVTRTGNRSAAVPDIVTSAKI